MGCYKYWAPLRWLPVCARNGRAGWAIREGKNGVAGAREREESGNGSGTSQGGQCGRVGPEIAWNAQSTIKRNTRLELVGGRRGPGYKVNGFGVPPDIGVGLGDWGWIGVGGVG